MNVSLSAKDIEPLLGILRVEISEYATLLYMIEEHQRVIFFRDAPAILELNQVISEKISLTQGLKVKREQMLYDLLESVAEETKSMRMLFKYCPDGMDKLLDALIDSLIDVAKKAQEKTKLNTIYLKEALSETKFLLTHLHTQQKQTYNKKGMVYALKN